MTTVATTMQYTPVDLNQTEYPNGYQVLLVNQAVITATISSAVFQVPYINAGGKARLAVVTTAVSGTTPSMTVAYQETLDGVNFNTAALTTSAITTATTTWSSAFTMPIFNQAELTFTVSGTTPSLTTSVWLVVWQK